MNTSPTMWIAIGLLVGSMLGASLAVLAQKDETPTVPTADHQDSTVCWDYAVKYHRAATEVGNPDQESYVTAAEQFEWMENNGQVCQ